MADLCFLDTETTGLTLDDDVWEIAAVRRSPDGSVLLRQQMFVEHDREKAERLPEPFLSDYRARYDPDVAVSTLSAARRIHVATAGAHVVGAVPSFDTERLALLLDRYAFEPEWHYHLIDVEILAVGYLANSGGQFTSWHSIEPPWDSEVLSRAVGVDPEQFARHTAMGDVEWAQAIFDAIMPTRVASSG